VSKFGRDANFLSCKGLSKVSPKHFPSFRYVHHGYAFIQRPFLYGFSDGVRSSAQLRFRINCGDMVMVAMMPRPTRTKWQVMSFASTLYLSPILELLLESVPVEWQMEVHLGLQEALVNAAKHGNQLDPSKQVEVRYQITSDECSWIIADQGDGFSPPQVCQACGPEDWIGDEQECGRGLFILHQIFDQVKWSPCGTELHLRKQVRSMGRSPYLV
jgi:serine/threonine-protein kinase RsbW